MKASIVKGDVLDLACGALIVGVFKDSLTPSAQALDKASGGLVSKWMESGDIHGCVGKCAEFFGFPGAKAERVIFVGLGKKGKARELPRILKLGLEKAYLGKEVVITCLEWLPDEIPEWIAQTEKLQNQRHRLEETQEN